MKKELFYDQKISAYDALYEAQKIAFAPVIFHVARALCDTRILSEVENAGKTGITASEISETLGISTYGIETLLESAHSSNIVNFSNADDGYKGRKYSISKIGHYLLHDQMTRVNMEFNHLVCYEGMLKLAESVTTGSPRGLEVFGRQWKTLYEALPNLPPSVKDCWDRFDHFYSSTTYPKALPLVMSEEVNHLVDIGANSGEFSILVAEHFPRADITMVDLPSQMAIALDNVAEFGLEDRIKGHAMDVLDAEADFPSGAEVYWMSQFLSCFSPEEITGLLNRISRVMPDGARIFILETCWDRQQHEASAFSLINTSPYFTCMANGNSKMYHSEELTDCIHAAGLAIETIHDNLGICHTLFECAIPVS